MRPIGLREVQTTLTEAFTAGLRVKYGSALAALAEEVIAYRPHVLLEPEELHRCVALDTAPVVRDIVANKVSGATLRGFRSVLIGAALENDKTAVLRWATEAANRCRDCEGDWPASAPQWQTVVNDPDKFILLTRQIKYFMNQI